MWSYADVYAKEGQFEGELAACEVSGEYNSPELKHYQAAGLMVRAAPFPLNAGRPPIAVEKVGDWDSIADTANPPRLLLFYRFHAPTPRFVPADEFDPNKFGIPVRVNARLFYDTLSAPERLTGESGSGDLNIPHEKRLALLATTQRIKLADLKNDVLIVSDADLRRLGWRGPNGKR